MGMQPHAIAPQTTPENLTAYLRQVAARDRAAFTSLYSATSMKLFGIVLRILKRRDLAEDVLQDVYVKIWEKAGNFEAARGSAIAWLAAVARNRALDEIRHNQSLPTMDDAAQLESIAASNDNPIEAQEKSDDYHRLMNCLSTLEDEKRSMILLAYQDGLSRDQLAARFDKPTATVKTWLRRGLQALKECLSS